MQNHNWQTELEQLRNDNNPQSCERLEAWKTAIGLQAVDGPDVSKRLIDIAKKHIEGKISLREILKRILNIREQHNNPDRSDPVTADLITARCVEILLDPTFLFSSIELLTMHRRLFHGIYPDAGCLRTCNLFQMEPFLKGDSVTYPPYERIIDLLRYDLQTEKDFYYDDAGFREVVLHYAQFVANLWQIHPFREGNTMTVSLFILKHIRSFGMELRRNVFAEDSMTFRNALLLANYSNTEKNIHPDLNCLVRFLSNLLVGTRLEVFRIPDGDPFDGRVAEGLCPELPETITESLSCTFREAILLNYLYKNPTITQKELAEKLGKPYRHIHKAMNSLQEKGFIHRVNGNRYGHWEVRVEKFQEEKPV